jgi:hypothetical protein
MKLSFQPKDFKDMRSFEAAVKRQLGPNTYVGTDSMTVFVEFSPELKVMLRPFPAKEQFEFEFTTCVCKCGKPLGYQLAPCSECISKEMKKRRLTAS